MQGRRERDRQQTMPGGGRINTALAGKPGVRPSFVEVCVLYRLPDSGKRILNPLPVESLPNCPQSVDHSCDAGILAERDETIAFRIDDLLIVYQAALKFK